MKRWMNILIENGTGRENVWIHWILVTYLPLHYTQSNVTKAMVKIEWIHYHVTKQDFP